jgi:hypothetical protein
MRIRHWGTHGLRGRVRLATLAALSTDRVFRLERPD